MENVIDDIYGHLSKHANAINKYTENFKLLDKVGGDTLKFMKKQKALNSRFKFRFAAQWAIVAGLFYIVMSQEQMLKKQQEEIDILKGEQTMQ
jgi:hypothetical protein